MKRSALISMLSVILVSLSISPALAGKVTVTNFSSHTYVADYKTYLFGIPSDNSLRTEAGETKSCDDVFGSIGEIKVWDAHTGEDKGFYTPPGTWLPWRKFIVIIDSTHVVHFTEN